MTRSHDTINTTYSYTPDEDRIMEAYDHQGFTPDDVRRTLGITPDNLPVPEVEEPFMSPADHKPANGKAAAVVQWGDNAEIENEKGLPHYYEKYVPLPEEQIALNRDWISNRKERGDKLAKEKQELIKSLKEVEDDIAATMSRREALELGHPIRGRETNRLERLEEQKTRILARIAEQLIDLDEL